MSSPTNPALEAAIRTNRDDPAPYLVYADWLQSQGSPLGELIVLEHALLAAPDPAKRARADAILQGYELPDAKLATFGGTRGLWRWVRLENQKDWMDSTFDAPALAQRVFTQPMCRLLDELRIGVLRWEVNYEDVPAVLEVAGAQPWAAGVTRLHLGDVYEIDMAHHVIGDVGARITKHFPNLVWLKLHSGEQSWSTAQETFGIAGLELPKLTELAIETCSLSKDRCAALLAAKLPSLERLELWFGSQDQQADCDVDDLAPLLSGTVFPGVRHLGLRNAEFTDAIARTLPGTPIAQRLRSLDLSMGTFNDDAAVELAAAAAQLPNLETLNVDDNFLTARGLDALRAAFRQVESSGQKDIDGDYRYVTVGE
jgi:uncharacterized protein (TIGR02996 family)